MKKKMIAALCAALTACCTLSATGSAAGSYKKGDVNMDGIIDLDDAYMILQEYVNVAAVDLPISFTDEQMELATIYGEAGNALPFGLFDAYLVLCYYTDSQVLGKDVPDDIVEYLDNALAEGRFVTK